MTNISSSDITLSQLRALCAVADFGTFTAAARALGTSQSAISQSIASFEAIIGGQVVNRGSGQATPTALGARVLPEAREVLSRVAAIQEHGAAAAGLEVGTLRLATVPSAAARLVPAMLRRFHRRHPGIALVLLEGTDVEVARWVADRVADAGFLGHSDAAGNHFATSPVGKDELLLVMPRRHHLARMGRVGLSAVARERLLLSSGGCEPLIRSVFREADVEPTVIMSVREMSTLLSLVREGLGVTLVPALALPPTLPSGLTTAGLRPAALRRLVIAAPSVTIGPVLSAFLTSAGLPRLSIRR